MLCRRRRSERSDVGQGMLNELVKDLEGQGRDVGPGQGGLEHVHGVAHRRDDDLRVVGVVVEDGDHLGHAVHAGLADVVEASHEGGDERRPGFGREQGLHGREG